MTSVDQLLRISLAWSNFYFPALERLACSLFFSCYIINCYNTNTCSHHAALRPVASTCLPFLTIRVSSLRTAAALLRPRAVPGHEYTETLHQVLHAHTTSCCNRHTRFALLAHPFRPTLTKSCILQTLPPACPSSGAPSIRDSSHLPPHLETAFCIEFSGTCPAC